MKIEDTQFIFLAFKRVLDYSEEKVLNTLKEWIKTNLNPKKINKKLLVKLFNTLNEYCKNVYTINIEKRIFVYDIKSIILRFNWFNGFNL